MAGDIKLAASLLHCVSEISENWRDGNLINKKLNPKIPLPEPLFLENVFAFVGASALLVAKFGITLSAFLTLLLFLWSLGISEDVSNNSKLV